MAQKTINQALLKAGAAYKSGDVAAAKRLLSKIIKIEPNQPDANSNMGAILVASGDLEEALLFIKTALEANFSIAQYWFNYIDVLFKLDRFTEASELMAIARNKGCKGRAFGDLEKKLNSTEVELKNRIQRLQKLDEDGAYNYFIPFGIGEALQNLGKLEEAIEAYNKALDIKPDYAEAYYNMGIALKDQGKLEEAIEAYNKALAIKPDYAEACSNMGIVLKEQGKLEEAIEAYNKALVIKPDYAEACSNMGIVLKDQGKLEEAIEAYNKALAIKPDYAKAYYNIGITLKDQGKLEEAIDAYNKALTIKPDYADAYYNMGNALKEQGKLEEALAALNKALAINPGSAEATETVLSLQTQLQGMALNTDTVSNQATEGPTPEITQRPKYQIFRAISFFLSADQSKAHRHIQNFNSCHPKLIANLIPQDKLFCSAYSGYLGALLQESFEKSPDLRNDKLVYHLGESHCLSYAHRNIEMNGATFRVAPMITFGAKAFHFAKTKHNAFKAITKANLDSIPSGSNVFISFGEIDCRLDEGFISAATKLNKPIEELVVSTVIGYLKWFYEQNKTQNHSLYILNVPAPMFSKAANAKNNAIVADVVASFNAEIAKHVVQYGFNLIDVFAFTLGRDRFSNNKFHVDGHHLGPKAIPEIEYQLNN